MNPGAETLVLPDLNRPVRRPTPTARAFLDAVVAGYLEPLLGWSALHQAAGEGSPRKMKNLLTTETLRKKDYSGDTPLHVATARSLLQHVPKRLLTHKAIVEPNNAGETVAHYAVRNGQIDQLPKTPVTAENLSVENQNRLTAAD